MKMVVLDGFGVNPGDLSWDLLKEYGELTVYDRSEQSEIVERCKDADVVLTNRAKLTEETMSKCPNLNFINALGTGYDMIDLEYCRQHGIVVCNAPGYSTDSVAQLTFSLILDLTTDIRGLRSAARSGLWTGMSQFRYQELNHLELAGKTLGLVGCGAIGKRVAAIAMAFGMKVVSSTATRTEGTEGGITFMPLEEMLPLCDIVSLHCPLNDKTRGLVNKDFISKLKKGVILINTARGAVIDEAALFAALESGEISAAGLDVMTTEPPQKDNPLLSLDNCLITPHIAWASVAARRRLLDMVESNIAVFKGGSDNFNGRII